MADAFDSGTGNLAHLAMRREFGSPIPLVPAQGDPDKDGNAAISDWIPACAGMSGGGCYPALPTTRAIRESTLSVGRKGASGTGGWRPRGFRSGAIAVFFKTLAR